MKFGGTLQRQNRGPPQNKNTNINPVETETQQQQERNRTLISVLQGMQVQMGAMENMMATLMRVNSDTESQPDREWPSMLK